jgi:hypothetical protein
MLCSSDSREPGVAVKPRAVLGTYGGGLRRSVCRVKVAAYVKCRRYTVSAYHGHHCESTSVTRIDRAQTAPCMLGLMLLTLANGRGLHMHAAGTDLCGTLTTRG